MSDGGARKKFIRDDEVPDGALTWSSPAERASLLYSWRRAVMAIFAEQARVLRVAWALEWKFRGGYCFAADSSLARETSVALENVWLALKALHDGGAIIRCHVQTSSGVQRRIFPASKILERVPATVTGTPTRHGERKAPATVTGQNRKEREPRLSATQLAARREAEIRERSGRGH